MRRSVDSALLPVMKSPNLAPSTTAAEDEPILRATDRCDRCRGRAYVVTVHQGAPATGSDAILLWCAHCFSKHRPDLSTTTLVFLDERPWRAEDNDTQARPKVPWTR